MPKVGVSKETLEGIKPVPAGVYTLILDGWEPKLSKDKQSVNLNPILKVINNPQHNGHRVWCNLNLKAGWILQDFSHCFGLPMEQNGDDIFLPGGASAWSGPDNDPTKWKYNGPLNKRVGKVELIEVHNPGQKPRNDIKQFICAIDGCATKYPDVSHSTNLIK